MNILNIAHQTFAPDVENSWPFFDISTAGVLIIGIQCIKNIIDGNAISIESVGIHGNLVLLQFTAKTADFRYAFDLK
ncbi:Uncharacterised protein [Mycobacterium tuberculosis]|nr:Uncharacterised protein [Mycobacterium tuberculosis]